MGFATYSLRRLVGSLTVVIAVAFLSFAIITFAPGDPAQLIAGEGASPEYVSEIRKAYGLDRPLVDRFFIYITTFLRGDWGFSLTYNRPVIVVMLERLPQTILLVGTALAVSIYVGVKVGVLSASKPHSMTDNLLSFATLVFYSIPVFWLGLILILTFSLHIPIFPTGGIFDVGAERDLVSLVPNVLWHMVLPVATLSTFFMAIYARLTRSGMLDVLRSPFILAARAKGLPEERILHRHALKNTMIPIVAVAGVQFGLIVGGVVLTESVYSWPGIGSLLVQAVSFRDYPLVSGILILTSISVAISNFVADLIIAIIDPRVKIQITGR